MTNQQKQILFWVAIAVGVTLVIFLLALTNQTINTAATTNTVSFSGEGKITAKPDIAVISASIISQGANSKAAQDSATTKSNAVITFLKKQNIDDKDIKTTGYNIYPQYKYPQQTITGYQVNQSLEITIRNLDKVSAVLDGLVTAGAEQVNNLGLQVENPDKLKSEARAKAIEDAKSKAKELENQVGIRLGKIVNFSEDSSGYPTPMYEKIGNVGGGGGPSIPTGENEITVDVTLTYQIR